MTRQQNRSFKTIGKMILVMVAAFFLFRLPLPYYIESPGSAIALEPLVEIEGEEPDMPGTYMLTTVQISQATPISYLSSFFPFHDGMSERELLGSTESYEEYDQLQRFFMENSKNNAVEAAFNAADRPYRRDYKGVYVMSVLEESDFNEKLQPGDTIMTIDGQSFESSQKFMDYVKQQSVGQSIRISYERDGEVKETSGQLIQMEETGNPGIGISLVDHSTIETQPEVAIDSGLIGGPSAGFMFALQIYTLLEDPELTNGMDIAGTGTITPEGDVGRIGGIGKKVVAADEAGASLFFAPNDEITEEMKQIAPDLTSNYEEARAAAEKIQTEMEIVPVQHMSEAIDYLQSLE